MIIILKTDGLTDHEKKTEISTLIDKMPENAFSLLMNQLIVLSKKLTDY